MLSVKENTFMGREVRRGILLDKKAMQAKTRVLLEQLNCSAPCDGADRHAVKFLQKKWSKSPKHCHAMPKHWF